MALTRVNQVDATISTTETSLRTGGTTLGADTTIGYYQVSIEIESINNADVYKMILYEKASQAATQRVLESWLFSGVPGKPAIITPSFPLGNGWEWTIKKVSGTDRTVRATLWKAA